MEDKACFVYIIKCNNGRYYTGITNDVIRRWGEHKKGTGAKYTKVNGFGEAVFLEGFENKGLAMIEENRIKNMTRKRKEKHIKFANKTLLNIYLKRFINNKLYNI